MANEHSQIVPSMQPTSTVADFKFWCQKVLPLVYDDSLSYYEVLNKMVVYLNQVIDNINADTANVAELEDDFLLLQTYVNNFFDDIDQLVTYTERAEAAQTAAATSAINAATSASNAATSASNSAGSASSAATSALSAMDAKDAAVVAKTAAETALASAQTAATNAANSATAASGSATNAATSAASALQNFQLSDAARTAAQSAAASAESDAADAADSAAEAAAAVDTVVNGLGNITKTIENVDVANIDDGLASLIKKIAINISPYQTGVNAPSPSNIRNFSGWNKTQINIAAKNILPTVIYNGGIYNPSIGSVFNLTVAPDSKQFAVSNDRKEYTITTSTAWEYYTLLCPIANVANIMRRKITRVGGAWTYGYLDKNFKVIYAYNNTDANAILDDNMVPSEETRYFFLVLTNRSTAVTTIKLIEPQVEYNSTSTDFEPYNGSTYEISFPVDAGTVYGGTLSNENGVWKLSVDKTLRNAKTINWTYGNVEGVQTFCCNYETAKPIGKRELWCSHFRPVVSQFYAPSPDMTITNVWARYYNINVRYDALTSLEEWNTFINTNDVEIVWYISEPIEYTLSDTQALILLSGTNNIWADTGKINELEYFTNAENYVTSQVDLAKALIAPVLKDMIADDALVANDFRIVGNTLYRITGNIASGGTLTPNTNCVATTVGIILKSLLSE